MMKKVLIQSTLVVSTVIGCYAILSANAEGTQSVLAYEKQETAADSSRGPASIASPIAQRAVMPTLSHEEQGLMGSSDVNMFERELKVAIVSRRHSKEVEGGEQIGGEVVKKMKRYPKEALAAFRSLLTKLTPEEFPLDRASLIDVMADFPELQAEAKQIAIDELSSSIVKEKVIPQDLTQEQMNEVMSSDDFEFLPMIAHSVVMRTTKSQSEALTLTVFAISKQENLGIRGTIANQFIATFPHLEKNLSYELHRARIAMPVQDGG